MIDFNNIVGTLDYRGYTLRHEDTFMSYCVSIDELPGVYLEQMSTAVDYIDSLIAGEPMDHLLIDKPIT